MGQFVKNIDKAPLPKSTITVEEKINKEIYEDSDDYSLKNKEFSLSSSEPSYEYFSIVSDDDSPTTVNVNDEHSMSNKSDISDDFNGTESYDQEHTKGIQNQVQKSDTKRTHNNKILRTNLPTQTARQTMYNQEQEKLHQHKEE